MRSETKPRTLTFFSDVVSESLDLLVPGRVVDLTTDLFQFPFELECLNRRGNAPGLLPRRDVESVGESLNLLVCESTSFGELGAGAADIRARY